MDTTSVNIGGRVHQFTHPQINSLVDDLRESVADYRNQWTTLNERLEIQAWWDQLGVKNQFDAMLTAARLEKLED